MHVTSLWDFIASVKALLLMSIFGSVYAQPTLSCAETTSVELVPLKIPCVVYQSDVQCNYERYPAGRGTWKTDVMFQILEPVNENHFLNNNMNITMCIGIYKWRTKKLASDIWQQSVFDPLGAGIVIIDRQCWNSRGGACRNEVRVRADVAALPLLASAPDEAAFWDFSSPLLRADLRWLAILEVHGVAERTYPGALRGLAGSSVRGLFLDGYFGSDENGFVPDLRHLPRLIALEIVAGRREELTSENLRGSENIQYLSLIKNRFHEIPNGIHRLINLTTLRIESNARSLKFTSEWLSGFKKLKLLSLSGTTIDKWTEKNAQNPGLQSLDISGCGVSSFSTSHLHIPDLITLDLSNNAINSLTDNTFDVFQNLTYLYLQKNNLSLIPDTLFTRLQKLASIDLSFTHLTKWPKFKYSKQIILSGNQLTTIDNLGNAGMEIEFLDLSQNKIAKLNDPNIFLTYFQSTTGSEKKKEQEHNKKIVINTLQTTERLSEKRDLIPCVRKVNLSMNNIVTFSMSMLDSMVPLEAVDLGGNPIDCADCSTPSLQRWLSDSKRTILVFGKFVPLTCHQPHSLRGQPIQTLQFDEQACVPPRPRLLWGMGLPLLVLGGSFIVLSGIFYCYRTEVAYLAHLVKVRRTSKRKDKNRNDCDYDAFICYSGKNRKWVTRRLARLLECPPHSYRLCLFDRDFRLGSHIVSNIADAIDTSHKVIVILTDHFIASKWCQWELEMANHKLFGEDRHFLVLLELEPLERGRLPRLLRFLLDTRPVVRWPRPETAPAVLAAAAQLRRALGPSLRQRRAPPPPPPPPSPPSRVPAGRRARPRPDERTPLLPPPHAPPPAGGESAKARGAR